MLFPGGLAISSEGGLLLLTAATSLRLGGLTFSWARDVVVSPRVGLSVGAFSRPRQGGSLFSKIIAPVALGGFTFFEASCAVFSPAGPDFSSRLRLSSLGGSAFSRGAFLFAPLGFASSQRRRIFMGREVDFLLLKLALRHSGG